MLNATSKVQKYLETIVKECSKKVGITEEKLEWSHSPKNGQF